MLDRLFGLESEYVVAPGAAGVGESPDPPPTRLLDRARRRRLHLGDASGCGLFLTNGGRLSVDCRQRPEVATPEVADPWDAVRYVVAGDRLVEHLGEVSSGSGALEEPVTFRRGHVDYDALATWGCHESVLCRGPLAGMPRQIVPHLVSRVVLTGAGGFDPLSVGLEFMLSPRMALVEKVVSCESTTSRSIFQANPASLCEDGYSRLHIRCGENLCSETATWLKVATTVLIVALVEGGQCPGAQMTLADPLSALRAIASDASCSVRVPLLNGERASALEIQRHYLQHAETCRRASFMPPWTEEACRLWRVWLDRLGGGAEEAGATLDWAIKRRLFQQHATSRGFSWDDLDAWTTVLGRMRAGFDRRFGPMLRVGTEVLTQPDRHVREYLRTFTPILEEHGLWWNGLEPFLTVRQELHAMDAAFAELGEAGLFRRLDRAGRLDHRMSGVERIEEAVDHPPQVGRARARGELVRRYAQTRPWICCGWDQVFDPRSGETVDLSSPFTDDTRWLAAAGHEAVGVGALHGRSGGRAAQA